MKDIRFADASDIPEIRELWEIAFGGEEDFNNYFFDSFFDAGKTLVCKINGKLAAMTQMFDYTIPQLGDVTYIYGAATRPELRSQGIMSALLEQSFIIDKEGNKAGSVLIPADSGLFGFYSRFGYKKAFYVKNAVYTANSAKITNVGTEDISFLNRIYENELKNIPHPARSPVYWKNQIKMFISLGGFVYKTNDSYAFGYPDKIEELMGESKQLLAAGIAKKLGKSKISAVEQGTDIPFGMIKPYKSLDEKFDKMYFNLMFN